MGREISAGAVVVRKSRDGYAYLLLLSSLGHWDFPKGHIERDEEEIAAARREIEEETGITRLQFVDGFRETIRYTVRWNGKLIFKVVVYFLVITQQKRIVISHEHTESAWLPYDAAVARVKYKNSKELLTKAHQFLQNHHALLPVKVNAK